MELWQRIVGVSAVVVVALFAVSLPRPVPEDGPAFAERVEPRVEASAQASVWYCPWIHSGATRDSSILIAAETDVDAAFTHPDPRVGEPADVGVLAVDGPGAAIQDVGAITRRGDSPGFVEFSAGPATASAMVRGETALSGDRCMASVPKLWHLPGLTTREGYDLTLRLFNPFPDNAKVIVTAASELGTEVLPDLQSLDVAGRTWIDVDLSELIPFLDNLVVTIGTDEGVVLPSIIQTREVDEASWPGTGLSTQWEFPTATLAALTPRLSVWNPNEGPVEVEVDLYTRTGAVQAAFTATVEGGRPVSFPIGEQSSGAVGIRVRATGAVAAVVVAEDVALQDDGTGDDQPTETLSRIAGTVGAAQPSATWLLAGAGAPLGGETSIWLLNTSAQAVTVTLQPLGREPLTAEKVRVEAGTFVRFRASGDARVAGYRVDAAAPITVSWSLRSPDAVAMFAGVAVED